MKALFTLILILTTGLTALANTNDKGLVLNENIVLVDTNEVEHIDTAIEAESGREVARLYKFKNSRIKKALAFNTKRNRAKMS